MAMWVFRITRGWGGGEPQGVCPVGVNWTQINSQIQSIAPTPLVYGNEVEFVLDELFNHGKLRQGWGIPGLDVRQPNNVWIDNYIIGAWQYWGERVTCNDAMGRKNILDHMLDMRPEDVIFIPNVSPEGLDSRYFTVAKVSSIYDFQNRSSMPNTWEKDFGHIIGVANLSTYPFSANTLPRFLFAAPFLHAIDPIPPHYSSHSTFMAFIQDQYRQE